MSFEPTPADDSDVFTEADQSAEWITMRLAATPNHLGLARLALSGVAQNVGMPPEQLADLKLALTEACTNVVQHAYPDGGDSGGIQIRFDVTGSRMTIEVADSGVGFDPDSVPHPVWGDGSAHGMGLAIMRAVSDESQVGSDESGTRVSFVKYFGTSQELAQ